MTEKILHVGDEKILLHDTPQQISRCLNCQQPIDRCTGDERFCGKKMRLSAEKQSELILAKAKAGWRDRDIASVYGFKPSFVRSVIRNAKTRESPMEEL